MSAMEPPRSKQLWAFGLLIMLLMCQSICSGASSKRMIKRESTDGNGSKDAHSTNNSTMDSDGETQRASRRDAEIYDDGYISNGERGEGGNENNFQVPKSLCSACEKFPWTPVAGAEYVRNNAPQFRHQQPGSHQQPTAPGSGGNFDVGSANRKPFAISSDIQNGNAIFPISPRPLMASFPVNQLSQYGTPTVLRPVNPTNLGQYSRPSFHGPIDQSLPLPISSSLQQPSGPAPVTQYVRPTILQPVSPSYGLPQQTTGSSDGSSQQEQSQGSGLQIQDVEPAQLIYQEHSQQQGNPPDAPSNQYGPPMQPSPLPPLPPPPRPLGLARPQNFRIPIIPRPFLGRPVNQFRFPPRLNFPESPKGNAGRFVNRPIQFSLPGPSRPFASTQGYNNPPPVVVQSSYSFPPSAPPTTNDFSVSGPSPQGNTVLTGPARPPSVQYGAPPPPPMGNNGPSLLPPSFPVKNTPSPPPPAPTQNTQLSSSSQQIPTLPPQPSVQYGPPPLPGSPNPPSPNQGFPLPPNPPKNVHSPIPPPVQQNYQIPFSAGVPLLPRPSQGVRLLPPPQQNVPSSPQSQQPVPLQPNPQQGALFMSPPKAAAPSIPQPPPQNVPLAPTQPLDALYIPPSPTGPPSIPAQQLVQTGPLKPQPSGQYLPPKGHQETHPDAQLPQDQTLQYLGPPPARPPPLSTYLPPTPPRENSVPELNHPLPHVQNAPAPPPLVPYSSVDNTQGQQVQNEQVLPQRPPPPIQIQSGGYEPAVPPPPPQYLDQQQSLQPIANELPPPGMLEMRPPPPPPPQIGAIAPIFLHSGSLFPQPPRRPLVFPTNQFTPPAPPSDQPQQTEQQQQQVLPASDSLVQPGSQLPPGFIFQKSHQPEPQYEGIPEHMIQMFPPPPTIQGQAPQNVPPAPPLGIAQGIVNGQPVNYDSLVPVQSIEVASFETNSLPGPPSIASPQLVGDSIHQPIQGPVMNLLESISADPEVTTSNPYRVEVRGQQSQDPIHIEYLPASTIDTENPDESKSTPNEAKNHAPNDNQNFLPSHQITPFSPQISAFVDYQSAVNNGAQQEQPSESVNDDQIHVGGALTDDSAVGKSVPSKFLGNNGNWEIIPAKQYDISHLFHNPQHDSSASMGPSQSYITQNSQPSVNVDSVSPTVTPHDYSIQAAQNNEIGTAEVNFIPGIPLGSHYKTPDHSHEPQTSDESSKQSSQVTSQEHNGGSQEVSQHFPTSPENILAASNHHSQLTSGNSIQESQDVTSKTTDGPLSVGIPIVESAESTLEQGSQFDPMPSAVVNALHHAQRTSFLTHTHLGDDTSKGTVYIESVPVVQGNSSSSSNDNSVDPAPTKTTILEQGENGIVLTNALRVDGASPGATVITPFNCSGGHMAFEVGQDGQTIVKAYPVKTHPGFYYPTPQSSVYWAEQPLSESVINQGLQSDGDKQSSSSSSQTAYSSPVFGWSPQLIQTSSAVNPDASVNHVVQTQKRQQQDSFTPIVSATVASLDDSSASQNYPSRSTDSSGMFKAIETTTKPSIFSRRPSFSRPSFFRPSISAGRSRDAESQPLQESTSSTTPKYAIFADGNSIKAFSRLKMPKTITIAGSASSSSSTTEIPAVAISSTFGTTTTATLFLAPSSKKSSLKNGKPEKIRITVGTRFNAGALPISSNVVQAGAAASLIETTEAGSTADVRATSRTQTLDSNLDEQSTSDASDISSISSALPTVPTYLGTGKYGDRVQQQGNKPRTPAAPTITVQSMHSLGSLNSLSDEADPELHAGKKRTPESSALPSNEDAVVLDSHNSLVSISSSQIPSTESYRSSSDPIAMTDSSQKNPISITPAPSDFPASSSPRMVMKVIKTVRVRQRMQSGGNVTTPRRNRLPGRVRVVQRPILRKQLKESQTKRGEEGKSSVLEFAIPEGEALGKEEEVEVKNALIDLKKISV